ncbi:MAG TPA: CPBP family intramembrane glutamic endopeptidase [Tepidisphaeraceae bacterium]|nr:CPBP family intramembrane glutamic endopeptidase [Tepidisphaeraceae bacterium]
MSEAGRVEATSAPAKASAPAPSDAAKRPPLNYFEHSRSPLASLAFVLPLVVLYEVGTRTQEAVVLREAAPRHVIAFTLMQQFFALFGATGQYLPALAIAGILIAWHLARRDAWRVRLPALGGIAIEGAMWCLPLLVIGVALSYLMRDLPFAAGVSGATSLAASSAPPKDLLILCLGAGIYEELVFRLIVLTLLGIVLKDLLLFPPTLTAVVAVLLSALLFSAYHYLAPEPFRWRTFAFRTLAGVYFGVLFLLRGFGVTAATHAAYDILVLLVLP